MKLIVEMEMPTVCDECPMMYEGIFCAATGTEVYPNQQSRILKNGREFDPCENRLDDCPIKGVLPDEHGDLVDADTVLWEVPDSEGIVPPMPVTIGDVIEGYDVPIVIAAERKDDEQIH